MLDLKTIGRVGPLAVALGVGIAVLPTSFASMDAPLVVRGGVATVHAPEVAPTPIVGERTELVGPSAEPVVEQHISVTAVAAAVVADPVAAGVRPGIEARARVAGDTALVFGPAALVPVAATPTGQPASRVLEPADRKKPACGC